MNVNLEEEGFSKKPVIPLFKGFGAFPGIYFLIKKFC
jgi:hypothetical protein